MKDIHLYANFDKDAQRYEAKTKLNMLPLYFIYLSKTDPTPNINTVNSFIFSFNHVSFNSGLWPGLQVKKIRNGKHRGPVCANSIHWHQIIASGRSVLVQMSLDHLTNTIWFEYLWILDLFSYDLQFFVCISRLISLYVKWLKSFVNAFCYKNRFALSNK